MSTLGNQVSAGALSAFADITVKTPANSDFGYLNTAVTGSATYSFLDGMFELGAKGGYETISSSCPDFFGYSSDWNVEEDGISGIVPLGIDSAKDYAFGGLFIHYFPVEGLRIHAAAGINNYTKSVSATIGLLYSFGTSIF